MCFVAIVVLLQLIQALYLAMTDYYINNLSWKDFGALKKMVASGSVDYPWFYGRNHTFSSLEFVGAASIYNSTGLGPLHNAIRVTGTNELIGTVVLLPQPDKQAEIGFFLRNDFRGQGIMSVAAPQVVKKAANIGWFDTLYATTHPMNGPSIAILKKLGLRYIERIAVSRYMERDGITPAPRLYFSGTLADVKDALQRAAMASRASKQVRDYFPIKP